MTPKTLIVVGAVAGGAAAVTRARRIEPNTDKLRIILIEKVDHISPASCGIPYALDGEIPDRKSLNVVPESTMTDLFNVEVYTSTLVTNVDAEKRIVYCKNLTTNAETEFSYDSLILSTGSKCFVPPIDGNDHPRLTNLKTLSDLDKAFELMESSEEKSCLVCGGGFIGLEATHALSEAGFKVSLVELGPAVFPAMDADMVRPVMGQLKAHGVDVHLRTKLTGIYDDGEKGIRATMEDSEGKVFEKKASFVLMAAGMRPASELAKAAGCNLAPSGHVVVDKTQGTNVSNLYCVGDMTQSYSSITGKPATLALANPASRQARVAAFNACVDMGFMKAEKKQFGGLVGTSICPVFGITVASTGLNTASLNREGIEFDMLFCSFFSHVKYYKPETVAPMCMKVFMEEDTGRIMGAQGFSPNGEALARRVDALAAFIQKGATYEDLAEFESCYNPWFGNPRDLIQYVGFAMGNVKDGLESYIFPHEFLRGEFENAVVVDVRNPDERDNVMELRVPHKFMPLPTCYKGMEELLNNGDVSVDTPVICMCASGGRSHTAQRVLLGLGFKKVVNLCGGISGLARQRPEVVIPK